MSCGINNSLDFFRSCPHYLFAPELFGCGAEQNAPSVRRLGARGERVHTMNKSQRVDALLAVLCAVLMCAPAIAATLAAV